MNLQKRQARAKARIKTMSLRRMGVPCTASKWGWMGTWDGQGLTPGEVQSARKVSRREPPIVTAFRNADGTIDQFNDEFQYIGAF